MNKTTWVPFKYFGYGIEGTRIIPKSEGLTDEIHDVMEDNGHLDRWEEDLEYAAEIGNCLRVHVPLYRISKKITVNTDGTYSFHCDWSWWDRYMQKLRTLGLEVIADLLHHPSFTNWMKGGFSNPEFPKMYAAIFKEFVERYPWVTKYTIINEPLVTNHFCSQVGTWYPFLIGDEYFMKALKNIAFAIRDISRYLDEIGKEHYYVDSCEYHGAADERCIDHAYWCSQTRFQLVDLLLGTVAANHFLYDHYLKGMTPEDIKDFSCRPAKLHCLGLNSYLHSYVEWKWSEEENKPVRRKSLYPIAFVDIAMHYAQRYKLPIMLTETNIEGTITDRITLSLYMLLNCIDLAQRLQKIGIPFSWLYLFPLIDGRNWNDLLQSYGGKIDTTGVIWIDEQNNRHAQKNENEFFHMLKDIYQGKVSPYDILPYVFLPPLDTELVGYIHGPMAKLWRTWRIPKEALQFESN